MIDYDPHSWWSHFFDIKGSMVRDIFYRVLSCVLWSIGVVAFHNVVHPVSIQQDGHVLIGVALGLLLVFRTNASYDRFWEARKQWGSIINETRNLGRAASAWLVKDPARVKRIVEWTILFPWATMQHLRNRRDIGTKVPPGLAEEAQAVLAADNLPLAVGRQITRELQSAREQELASDYVLMQLDQNVQQLVDYMGACERIHKTPLPFAYVVHLRRALILYCFTLPFALVEHFGWGAIAGTLVLAYILFGIEEIGVEIEDPFGGDDNDLPLERFCARVESDLRELLPAESPHL